MTKIQANASGTRSIEVTTQHLQTLEQYQLLRDLVGSHGYIDEDVLEKLKMNIRSLLHFFELRCCNRAQWEIRELAWKMYELVKPTAPYIFMDAGPGCVRGRCPEGKMTCGKPYPRVERD